MVSAVRLLGAVACAIASSLLTAWLVRRRADREMAEKLLLQQRELSSDFSGSG